MHLWAHYAPTVLASFLAALVEFVEALTIVLAVGLTRGWRSSLLGAAAGVILLALLVACFGSALKAIPLQSLQLVVGILLLLFGMRWLRKAILRSAGIIGLHDEEAAYARETGRLQSQGQTRPAFDKLGFLTSFKATIIEGLEVVFIVIAVGSTSATLLPAAIGAAAAGLGVIILGVALRAPLSQVPENTLKFTVGLILTCFGVFWIGEGLSFPWPGADWALLLMFVVLFGVSRLGVRWLGRRNVVSR
ncbi:MAG: hypothetical protein JWM32_1469 [Verrucomicrobia bacterium]|nr:hypothetical protein [Verrucomicrobiota bacterium]